VPLTYHMSQALTGHDCFQSYLYRRARTASPMCLQCRGGEDTVEHILFLSATTGTPSVTLCPPSWGHRPCTVDIQGIICGPPFDQLPTDPDERSSILRNAEESFRLFYGMVERILSTKEEEERVRQAAGVRR